MQSAQFQVGSAVAGLVEPLVALSTAHVSKEGLAWLQLGGEGAVVYPNEYGGFLHSGHREQEGFEEGVPVEVQHISKWARENGIVWVKFDPDGHTAEGLPTFDHS